MGSIGEGESLERNQHSAAALYSWLVTKQNMTNGWVAVMWEGPRWH
jgi:hypothetical protein